MSVRTIRICAVAAVVVLTAAVGWAGLALADSGSSTTSVQLASSDDGPGDISGPCDEPENAGRARCAGVATPVQASVTSTSLPATSTIVSPPTTQASTSTTSTSTTAPATPGTTASSGTRSFDAAGAGTVTYAVDGSTLVLVSATPTAGWVVEVEQASGRELELDLRSGDRRVQVNVEFEDGGVRERVRVRDDSDDSRVEITNGQVTDVDDDRGGDDDRDDDNSGSGHSGDDDDGSGSGGDDDRDDDNSGSGSGGDDDRDDDSGSGRGGSDDD